MRIPKSADYAANRRRYGNGLLPPCVVCGRPTRSETLLECVNGATDECVMPGTADTADPGYMGGQPVGPDCLRRFPQLRPYVSRP